MSEQRICWRTKLANSFSCSPSTWIMLSEKVKSKKRRGLGRVNHLYFTVLRRKNLDCRFGLVRQGAATESSGGGCPQPRQSFAGQPWPLDLARRPYWEQGTAFIETHLDFFVLVLTPHCYSPQRSPSELVGGDWCCYLLLGRRRRTEVLAVQEREMNYQAPVEPRAPWRGISSRLTLESLCGED